MADRFDPAIIEAEENFLIDCQFLLQEIMVRKGVSLSQLAEKAGVSKSRISQIMSPEANPTAKTFARLFHALGEEITLERKKKSRLPAAVDFVSVEDETGTQKPWQWTTENVSKSGANTQFVERLKETFASNDNHVVVMESELMMTLEAA